MIDLKPNGPPRKVLPGARYAVSLLAIMFAILWLQPVVLAEPADGIGVEGGITDSGEPVIHKISHRTEADTDIFTFSYRGELPVPSVELQADGLWLTLKGTKVDLPAGSESNFSTPVQGRMIGRLDVTVEGDDPVAHIGLISLAGAQFNYDIIFAGGGEFEVRCFEDTRAVSEDVVEEPAPAMDEPAQPAPMEIEVPADTTPAPEVARIVKVKYDPLGTIDRFTFDVEGPVPEVEVFSLKYPDRLKINVSPAIVDLPANADGRFDTPVPGNGITRMEVVNSELDNISNAGFTFSVAGFSSIDDMNIDVDASQPGRIVIDVRGTQISAPETVVEKPVQAPAPAAPAVEPQPALPEPVEVAEEEITIEDTEVAEVAAPVVAPVVEEVVAVEPEPVEPDRIPVELNLVPSDDGIVLQLKGTSELEEPEIKTLRYPTRLSVSLPYASLAFRGDASGDWKVDEGPVAKLRAGEFVGDGEYSSSLFIYFDKEIDADRLSTQMQPEGNGRYDLRINVEPLAEPPQLVAEVPAVPEPETAMEEAPVEEPAVGEIEIAVESYTEPSPPFIAPAPPVEPVESEEPLEEIALSEFEEVEPAAGVSGEAVPAIEAPAINVNEEIESLAVYPTFSLECTPNVNGVDRFNFEFDGSAAEPEIKRFNHPPRLMLVFKETEADVDDANPYDYTNVAGGAVVNRYKLLQIDDYDTLSSVVEIDATGVESPEEIGVDVGRNGNSLTVDVYNANTEPVERAIPEPMNPERIDEPGIIPPLTEEYPDLNVGDSGGTPEPAAMAGTDMGTPENLGDTEAAAESTESVVEVFNVKDGNIVDVLQVICAQAAISNIIDPSVAGRVSLSLQQPMPLSKVLGLLGDQANFDYYVKDGVYIFASERVLKDKFPEFYGTWIIELSYADPNQVKSILANQGIIDTANIIVYNPIALGVGRADLYSATRKLIIRASEDDMKVAVDIIRQMDEPPPQILYDIKVIQTSGNLSENFGIQWLTNTNTAQDIGAFAFALEEKPIGEPATGTNKSTEYFPQGLMRDPYMFNVTLNYLREHGQAKILANPTISALNGQPANYFVGQTVPYRSTFQVSDIGRVTQRVAQEQIGITINVIGLVASNNTITMFVAPEISNLLELTEIGPRTSNNRFATAMRVADGETFVIAGLINEEERKTKIKVPILGDLPLVGGLFRNVDSKVDTSELVLAITPHIIWPTDYQGPNIMKATGLQRLFTGE